LRMKVVNIITHEHMSVERSCDALEDTVVGPDLTGRTDSS